MNLDQLLHLKNLGGDFARLYYSVSGGKKTAAFSLNQGGKAHVSAYLDRFTLYVSEDLVSAREVAENLAGYLGDERVAVLPEKGDLLLHRQAFKQNIPAERVRALSDTLSGRLQVLVTTAEALMQYVPRPERLLEGVFTLEKDGTYDLDALTHQLARGGFRRVDQIEDRGEFSLKGDILSIFGMDQDLPCRISFFDERIESIKLFEPDSMMSIQEIEAVRVLPASDVLLEENLEGVVGAAIRKEAEGLSTAAAERLAEIWGDLQFKLETNPSDSALIWLLPFTKRYFEGLWAYLPSDTVVIWDSPAGVNEKMHVVYQEHKNRVKSLRAEGEVLPAHQQVLMKRDVVLSALEPFGALAFEHMTSANPIFQPDAAFRFKNTQINTYYLNYNLLVSDLKSFTRGGSNVLLCCADEARALAFKESLEKDDIGVRYLKEVPDAFSGIAVTAAKIRRGFNASQAGWIIIGRDELIRKHAGAQGSKKKRRVFMMPECGDYVVHELHGIGKCLGIERIKVGPHVRDFVVVDYRDADKLYVPVDQMDRLSRYSGSDQAPKLSKLGGAEFSRLKDRVKKSVKEMAFSLLELYSKRQKTKGFKYSEDNELQMMFEEAFPYTETDDQLQAVREIKEDMERGIVMDRLLCGDVGYGKTEVALRAVFKTVMEGKQAAILAPTTILARQHYNTALMRFQEFGVRVALLSRFQSESEIKAHLKALKDGKCDVVIATHRLLSKDVQFKDLGLLVLDEEQRFGVEHKERLKLFKNNVNVLTLSATPIPRTLNMALSGIRDISLLETPPENRLPIQTYVTELSDGLLKDAIGRELARGGQVFVLYNKVQTIDSFAAHIAALVPEAVVIVGHGQMKDAELEQNINTFYNKEANVLVCTTIIENGIDLPDANTLIVCDADRLGLSALYQLRGRVGRNNKLAYAYFTTKDHRAVSETALKRLAAIMDYTDLGSGFQIAMRDLEIRGAGNVLGREQHGQMAKVGYDLYCKLLEETIEELAGGEHEKVVDTEIVADVDAYLPDDYVKGENNKLKLYKEIAEIRSAADHAELVGRLTEAYGSVPAPVLRLADISLIKNLASKLGVKKVVVGARGAGMIFEDGNCFKNGSLMFAVGEMRDDVVLSAAKEPTLVFNAKHLGDDEKLALLKRFLALNFKEIA